MADEDIQSYGALQVINLVIFILSMILWLVSLVGFIFLRNVQPFKARSQALLLLLLCCIPVDSIKYFLILRGVEDCVRDTWIEASVGNATMFIYFMRAYRLLVIFNVTKKHFEDEESTEKDKKKRYFWQLSSQATDKNLIIILSGIILFFLIFPIIATIQYQDPNLICTSAAVRIGRGVAVIAFVLIIGINILLHKVHDGYFLKNEFRVLAVVSIISAVVGVAYLVVPTFLMRIVSAIVLYTMCMVLFTISFIVPIILAIRNKYFIQDYEASSSSRSEETNNSKSSKSKSLGDPGTTLTAPVEVPAGPVEERDSFKHFAPMKKAYKVLTDQLSYKYLEDYLIHYQDISTSDCLLFWYQLRDFRKTPNREFLTGKAWLLYQKYLKRGGYRFIDCCNDIQLAAMETTLKASMEEDGKPIEFSFFDEVIETIEQILIQQLFVPFFKSEFYTMYKQAGRLHSGIALLNSSNV